MPIRILGVLSGGSGTRLWPLSRDLFPKQFHDLTGSGSPLIIDTLNRLKDLGELTILTGAHLQTATMTFLHRFNMPETQVIIEPEPKNTAAAIALLTLTALRSHGRDALVGAFPADHDIKDVAAFRQSVERAFALAQETHTVVTLGVVPTYPSTAYGYLETEGETNADTLTVSRFIEKPSVARAAELIEAGNTVWNAGIFVFQAGVMADAFEQHMPDLWQSLQQYAPEKNNLAEVFAQLPSESIDYGIMEKLQKIHCVPLSCGWSDLGSWEEIAPRLSDSGAIVEVASNQVSYVSMHPRERTAVFVGVQDLIVVDTPDALLILKQGEGQKIKEALKMIKESRPHLSTLPSFEERPWGRFEVLLDTENFKSKRLIIHPGKQISYQRHAHRTENWTITKGTATITINDVVTTHEPGSHIHIPQGTKHRLANLSDSPLEVIEVQTGTYFGEDDIERFQDDFGRVAL